MRGFIVDQTYRVEHDKAYVYLFGRLENGKSFCTIHGFRPYFCIRDDDVQKAKKLPHTVPFDIEEAGWKTMREEPVAKVVTDNPKDVPGLRKLFEQHKIPCYEADIRFTHRFLMDHNILRSVRIEGAYEESAYVGRVYKEPTLQPDDWYPELKTLSFDIETHPENGQLYCISVVQGAVQESYIVSDKQLEHTTSFPDEKSLLEHFRKRVLDLDPDIITGWNSIDFDLQALRDKFRTYRIPFRLGRWDWDCVLRIESSFLKDSTADFPGRQVLDGIHLLKLNFVQLDNYKLATAAHELLGAKKLIGEENKGKEIVQAYRKDQQKLVDYNLKDAQLVLDILKKTNAIDIMLNRAMLTGMPLDRVRGSIASFDSLYLRELRKRGYVAQSGAFSDADERIKGGYVKESAPGIYDYVAVWDFKSLYPSIMRTFNIDPLAYERGKDAQDTSNKHKWITSPNDVVFSGGEAILPELLERLWKARDSAKRRKDARESFAIKILMNSFFGVLASPACRFYSLDMANAITSYARHFIQMTIAEVEARGYRVIYGDTDSVFVDLNCDSLEEAEKISKKVTRDINAFYEKHIEQEYRRKSYLELEAEKIFIRFIMPRVRGSEEGAKKRYAGTVMEDGKERVKITGLEFVRRDWTELAKEFQMAILKKIFARKSPEEYIRTFVQELKKGKHDDLLTYRKAVRKELEGYTKTTPPHVKAARLLEEHKTPLKSNIIEYVMTAEGPWPVQLKGMPAIDYDHYADKQLKPIADAILCFYDTSFDDVLKGSKQTTLGGY